MWLLSTFHILKFTSLNCYFCIVPVALSSLMILIKDKKMFSTIKSKIGTIIKIEIAFLIVFLLACYIKSFKPDIYGLEKFMDYGFMNIMDKSDYMPPDDMWFSGGKINYYYMGQFFATYLNKLADINISYGYNLALITVFSLAILSVFSISYNLIKQLKTKSKLCAIISGTISTISVNIAGNFHYTIYGLIIPFIKKMKGEQIEPGKDYSFWNSTRYIGYDPDTNDKTIHEFSMYSYIVGDLHAHVANIIFVLAVIALLLSYFINTKKLKEDKEKIKNILSPQLFLVGYLIGIFKMSNYWDFPIYTVVSLMIIIVANLKYREDTKNRIISILVQMAQILVIPMLVSIPFMMSFDKISSEIRFVKYSTPLWQLVILWGLPVVTLVCFIFGRIIKSIKDNKNEKLGITRIIKKIKLSDLFVMILGISAIGLVVAPEMVYVKDIYESTQPRANTMFKLTYQSFIMFGICFGYIIVKLLYNKKRAKNVIGVVLSVFLLSTMLYSVKATGAWFENIFDFSREKTLNGERFFEKMNNERYTAQRVSLLDDYEVIKWIRDNTNKDDVVLEELGTDFEYSNQVSTFTSRPTVLGWGGHEWLWRSKDSSVDMPESVNERTQDVNLMYTSGNEETINNIIKKYNIKYIVVGMNERLKYNNGKASKELASEEVIKSIGEVVFETNINEQKYSTYIVKVNENE